MNPGQNCLKGHILINWKETINLKIHSKFIYFMA